MVNANWTPEGALGGASPTYDLKQLRAAVVSGRYRVPAEEVALALLRWHEGFTGGRLPHEVAPSPRRTAN